MPKMIRKSIFKNKENLFISVLSIIIASMVISYTKITLDLQRDLFPEVILIMLLGIIFYGIFSCMLQRRHIVDLLFWGLMIFISIIYYRTIQNPSISFDTWQVYDMSRYVFDDFGYMQMIRQHIMNTHYEMAFPPLFPFLVAIVNYLCDMGVMATVFINYIVILVTICVLKNTGDYTGYRMPVGIASILFMCSYWFRDIFIGGSTQLLGFLIFVLIARLLIKKDFKQKDCFLTVFLAGLGLMNRFDFLSIAGVILLLTPFVVKQNLKLNNHEAKIRLKTRITWLLINILIMIGACSSWIIYSLLHFNKIFVTDNGRRLLNILDTRPSTYFSEAAPALTLFDDFDAWSLAFSERCLVAYSTLTELIQNYYIFKFLILVLFGGGITYFGYKLLRKKNSITLKSAWYNISKHLGPIVVISAIASQDIIVILTGYGDQRYHILFLFVINVVTLTIFEKAIRCIYQQIKSGGKRTIWKIVYGLVGSLMCLILIHDGYQAICTIYPHMTLQSYSVERSTKSIMELEENEETIGNYLYQQKSTCLVVYRSEATINIPRTCSLIKTSAMLSPTNLSEKNVEEYIQEFQVDFIYSSNEEFNRIVEFAFRLEKTPIEHLYKICR